MAKKRDWRTLVNEEEKRIENKKIEDFNSFLTDSRDYIQTEVGNYDAVGFSTYGNTYNQFQKSSSDWRDRAANARSYLSSIASYLSEEDYKGYLDYIDSFDKTIEGFDEGYAKKGDYYSQFANEDEMYDFELTNKYKDYSYKDIMGIVQRRGYVGDGEYLPEIEFNWLQNNVMKFAKSDDYDEMIASSNAAAEMQKDPYEKELEEQKKEEERIKSLPWYEQISAFVKDTFDYYAKGEFANAERINYALYDIETDRLSRNRKLEEERDKLQKEEAEQQELIDLQNEIKNRPDFDQLSVYVPPKETTEGKKGYNTNFIDQVNGAAPEVYEPIGGDPMFYANQPEKVGEYEFDWKKANAMTAEEKQLYTALYNAEKKGLVEKGSADKYLKLIKIDERATAAKQQEIAEAAKEDPVGATIASVLISPMKIPSTMMDIAGVVTGNDINTNDYYHQIGRSSSTARSAISEEMSDFGSFMYNTGVSMLESGYNMAIGGGDAGTSILMGMSAAGDAIVAAKDRGATDKQAVLTGIIAGAAEAFFEKVSLGNLKSISKSGGAGVKNFFFNVLKQSGVEASEEVFTEIANQFEDYMINGGASNFAKRIEYYMENEGISYEEAASKAAKDGAIDIFEAGAGGFVSGGAFGTFGAATNAVNNYQGGKSIIENGTADQLKTDASAFSPESTVGKRLSELTKKESRTGKQNASYTGALAQAIEEATYADLSTAEKTSLETYVKDTLAERGIEADEKTVLAVSKSLFGNTYGNSDLTASEQRIVERVNLTEDIKSELLRMKTASEQQANNYVVEEVNRDQSKLVEEKVSKMKVGAEGAGINSLFVKENGDVYITNGDGKTVLATDAELTEEAAEAVAYSEGMSAAKKQAFFEEYSSFDKTMPVDEYHTAFDLAYTYGINGMSVDQAVKYAGPVLSDRKAFEIYKKGATQRGQINAAIKENTAEIQNVLGENAAPGKVNDKAVRYNQIAPGDPRRAIVSFARVMAHATGRNVTFYQSTAKQQAEGMENGRYDPKTNTLYIDINAGIDEIRGVFEDQVLPTISHELVHLFHSEDAAGYEALEDLVFAGLKESTGKSRASIVAAERRRIEEADPKRFEGLSDEQRNSIAAEEITARACEDRLANSRMMKEFIADLENKESGLAQKFSNFLGEAVARVKQLFQQIISKLSKSSEAKSLSQLTESLEKIQKQFDTLLERQNYVSNAKNDIDEKYMEAVEKGDTAAEQRMVDEKAKEAGAILDDEGNPLKLYRGTKGKRVKLEKAKHHNGLIFTTDNLIIASNYADKTGKATEISQQTAGEPTTYAMYGFPKKMLTMDAEWGIFSDLLIPEELRKYSPDKMKATNSEIALWAEKEGYDAIRIKNVRDGGVFAAGDQVIFFDENILKSADPITYDDNGNVIPLSERFANEDNDIRYSERNKNDITEIKESGNKEIVSVETEKAMRSDRASEAASVEIDEGSKSAYPMYSERTWNESEYVKHRSSAAETISSVLGISKRKAFAYIDAINGVAKMIADDRSRLDYEASSFGSAFVSNVEYGGSFDFTTLCPKRRLYTGTFQEIQKQMPNDALTADEILQIRNLMIERGLESTCGLCYVEGSRAEMGKFSKEFIKLYKKYNQNAEWYPNMVDVNTPDGVEKMRINHPEVYTEYEYFWNHYGKLKETDPALFASQQKPKLYEARKEYKNEILNQFSDDKTVEAKNRNGGIRIQSFSDFEMVHMIDMMQIIMDMSRVKLAGQAYTKIPAFADAFGSTGLKINLSLIAKGVDANGKLIFDDREGMAHETAFSLREKYSKNVGTILVIFNDEQLTAAMADPRVDFIIPFHRSQWKKRQYGAMGLPKNTKDYTYQQNEKLIKQTYHEWRGKMVKDKAKNFMPNEYWDFTKSGKQNAEKYLKLCAESNKRPKFYKLLENNGDGTYSLKADGSTDGYWKLLIDFKMYDNKGKGAPQNPVTPDFSMSEIYDSIEAYEGGHQSYPVAFDVVDEFISSKNRVMKADRATYESARELLLQAAEEAEKTTSKNKSKLLAEYKSRVEALDRKYNRLEAAEQEYTASLDSSNKELSEKLYEKVSRLQKEINQTEQDLRLIEESKEMVKEYQKQWGEWLNAARQGVVMQKPTRPTDPKYDLAGIVRREKALTKSQTEKEVKVNAAKKLFDYKESVERKSTLERIDAKIRVFEKKLAKNTRKEHIPDDLKKSIENLIKAVRAGENFKEATDVPNFKEATSVSKDDQRKWVVETKNALRELKAAVKQNAQYDVAYDKKSSENEEGDDVQYSELLMIDENILQEMDAIATYLERVIDANSGYFLLSEMDLENLKGLDRVIGSVSRAISNVDKALASQGKQTISQLAEEDMKEMITFAKDNAKRSTLRTLLTWSQMTPYTAFSLFGKGGKQIYMNLLKGWGDYARYAKSVIDFAEESWTEKQVKKWSGTVNKYTLNGQEFEATPAQIMYLYCLNKRDQGLLHLNRDGFQVGPIRINGKTIEAKSLSKNAIKSTRQQRTEFFNEHLPVGSDERRVADEIQRFLSTTSAEWGNELSYKLYGYRAFTDPYYVPIIVDPTKLSASAGDFETGLYSMFNKGFMKPLNEKAKNGVHAVDLFDIFATHTADMAKYRAMGLPVLDAIHYMNYTKVEQLEDGTVVKNPDNMKTVMQATYGPAAFEYLKRFLKDLNDSAKIDKDATESAYASMVKAYKTAAVGFNAKVAALQPTSYYRALSVLSAKSMTKAVALLVKEKAENAFDKEKVLKYSELAQKYSGMTLWKSLGYFDVGIGRSLSSQIKHDETWKDKTIEIAMKGAEYGDKWTLGVLFKACCIEVQQNGSAKTQKEIYKAAGELLDEVIVRTQVVDSTMTRSQAMRSKSTLLKSLTSFMSEPTVGYNLLLQEYYKAANDLKKGVKPKDVFLKHKRSLGKTFAAYTVTALAAAAVETFFAAIRDDDDEELAEIAKTFGLKFYENMNPITKVPVVADLWEYIESLLLNKKMYSDNMAYASIDEAVTLVKSIIKIAKEGTTANGMYDVIENASNTASYATGIPIGNALRTVKRAWNNTIGELTGKKFGVKAPSSASQIEKAFEENQMASAAETLVAEKLAELKEERPNADPDDLEKRAISSVKASISMQLKEMYLEAYESKDRSTMRKIELALEDSGLYEDVSETLENWIEAYEKDKEEKGISSKKK